MALVACPAFAMIPPPIGIVGTIGFSSLTMNSTADQIGVVFQVPKTGNIRTITFRTGTVTTGDTIQIGLYTVDGSGDPTTTAYGGMTAGVVVVAASDDNVSKQVVLIADAAATMGDKIAVVLSFPLYVAGNMVIQMLTGSTGNRLQFPYVLFDAGGPAWTKQINCPIIAIEYDDGSYAYIPGVFPFTAALTDQTFNNTGVTDIGLKFTPTTPGRIIGADMWSRSASAADFDLVLYDSASNVLLTKSFDGDMMNTVGYAMSRFLFAAGYAVAAGSVYRLAIVATTANNVAIETGTVFTANGIQQATGSTAVAYTSRTGAGAWTDVSTRLPFISPIFDQLDNGAAGGGAIDAGSGISVVSVPVTHVTVW